MLAMTLKSTLRSNQLRQSLRFCAAACLLLAALGASSVAAPLLRAAAAVDGRGQRRGQDNDFAGYRGWGERGC